MPVAATIEISGRLESSARAVATLAGDLSNPSRPPATLEGTVSTAAAGSFGAPREAAYFYFRIRLAGRWIPEEDLVGPLTVSEDLDSHTSDFAFTVRGESYSLLRTETTWTRAAVEVHLYHGTLAGGMVGEEPALSGVVLSSSQEMDREPVLRIRCSDDAARYERFEVCYELAPFSGLTRGQIARDILASAGLPQADIPDGALFEKPVQIANRPLFAALRDFVEPEGWHLRMLPGGTVQAWEPRLVEPPVAPDWIWTPEDWVSIQVEPPGGVASRWVARGTSAVVVEDAGVETERTITETIAPYAPRVAVEEQSSSGSVNPTGQVSGNPVDRVVYRRITTTMTQAGRLIQQVVEEHRYYNPRAATQVSNSGSLSFLQVWIDEDGNSVRYRKERFLLVSRTITTPTYDAAGNRTSNKVETQGFHLRSMGVERVSGGQAIGAYIHGDGQSYSSEFEEFGRMEEVITDYTFDPDSGAEIGQAQSTYRHYAPRCRVDGPGGSSYWITHAGTGQVGLVANWLRVELLETTQVLDSAGLVSGQQEAAFGYFAPERVAGTHDWGTFRSDSDEEAWRLLPDGRTTSYRATNPDQLTITTREDGRTREQTVLSGAPVPLHLASAWTTYGQEPLEVAFEDPVLEAWWGFGRNVFEQPWVQSPAEARAVLLRRLRRKLSRKVSITMPLAPARVGDTVLLVDPAQGLRHRALVAARDQSWDLLGGVMATYRLEIPL